MIVIQSQRFLKSINISVIKQFVTYGEKMQQNMKSIKPLNTVGMQFELYNCFPQTQTRKLDQHLDYRYCALLLHYPYSSRSYKVSAFQGSQVKSVVMVDMHKTLHHNNIKHQCIIIHLLDSKINFKAMFVRFTVCVIQIRCSLYMN